MPLESVWAEWDAQLGDGRSPAQFLHEISDDSIVELLASAGRERAYEKDILRTELRNRLSSRDRALVRAAHKATVVAERVVEISEHARDEAVETEMLAEGVADLHEENEFLAEQAGETAIAAESARLAAEEAEVLSGQVAAAALLAKPRLRIED